MKEKLNDVIKNNINEQIVGQGQTAIAGLVYHKYLKDENGNQLYKCVDAARQNFQYLDTEGNLVTDVGAKTLTNAIVTSSLKKEASLIASKMDNLYENKEKFNNVMSITNEFEHDNSTFRKEIVHLTKIEEKPSFRKRK